MSCYQSRMTNGFVARSGSSKKREREKNRERERGKKRRKNPWDEAKGELRTIAIRIIGLSMLLFTTSLT